MYSGALLIASRTTRKDVDGGGDEGIGKAYGVGERGTGSREDTRLVFREGQHTGARTWRRSNKQIQAGRQGEYRKYHASWDAHNRQPQSGAELDTINVIGEAINLPAVLHSA